MKIWICPVTILFNCKSDGKITFPFFTSPLFFLFNIFVCPFRLDVKLLTTSTGRIKLSKFKKIIFIRFLSGHSVTFAYFYAIWNLTFSIIPHMANDALIRNLKKKRKTKNLFTMTPKFEHYLFFFLISICKTRFWSPTHHSRFLDANTLQ